MVSLDQVKSAALPIISAIGGAAVTFGLMSASQVSGAMSDMQQVWNGATQAAQGIGALITLGTTVLAAYRASKPVLAARVQASKTEQVLTTDKSVASAHPEIKLVMPVEGQSIKS